MQIVFNAQQDRKVCLGVLRSVSLELKSYLFKSSKSKMLYCFSFNYNL